MDLFVRLAQSCWKTALLKLWWLNTEAGQVPWEITLLSTCTHNSQALHSWLVVSWSCQDAHISVQFDGFISLFVLCLHIQGTGPKRTVGLQITLILSGNNDSKKKKKKLAPGSVIWYHLQFAVCFSVKSDYATVMKRWKGQCDGYVNAVLENGVHFIQQN